MNGVPLQPILAILAGVLILHRPSLLNYVVAPYLIVAGILGLIGPAGCRNLSRNFFGSRPL